MKTKPIYAKDLKVGDYIFWSAWFVKVNFIKVEGSFDPIMDITLDNEPKHLNSFKIVLKLEK